jgi:hypothetical protein
MRKSPIHWLEEEIKARNDRMIGQRIGETFENLEMSHLTNCTVQGFASQLGPYAMTAIGNPL